MVYIQIWDQYQRAVEDLYLSAPIRTRYVVKYRHCDGKLVLKVTDNISCLKYRTDKLQDLKKFERLNSSLMEKMQHRKEAKPVEGGDAAGGGAAESAGAAGGAGSSTPKQPGTPKQSGKSTPAGGVGKKRKGKNR
ncbi:Signal recognition particle protein [Borealophlyctis nickersoniae]|nr:Signal recognition particle protein [Borealophlyctis nickersoniae]